MKKFLKSLALSLVISFFVVGINSSLLAMNDDEENKPLDEFVTETSAKKVTQDSQAEEVTPQVTEKDIDTSMEDEIFGGDDFSTDDSSLTDDDIQE